MMSQTSVMTETCWRYSKWHNT